MICVLIYTFSFTFEMHFNHNSLQYMTSIPFEHKQNDRKSGFGVAVGFLPLFFIFFVF